MRNLTQIVLAAICFAAFPVTGGASGPEALIVREQQLRTYARKQVLPKYPDAALKEKSQGVVVTQIEFNTEGVVTSVEILESPGPQLSKATETALKQWAFNPIVTPKGEVYGATGKLTFYFYCKDGRGWAENPMIFNKNPKPPRS
jgi:TonB family protein